MIKTMKPDMSVLGTIKAGMSEDGDLPVSAWISYLPEIRVDVQDDTYFAGSDGYVWVATYDAKADFANDVRVGVEKSILVQNARWVAIEALSMPFPPDAVVKVEEAVASALTVLHQMPLDAFDEAFA